MKTSPSPARMARAAWLTAFSPEAHRRLTVTPATLDGQPGQQERHARHVAVILPGLVGAAQVDFFHQRRVELVAFDDGFDYQRGQVVRADARQRSTECADGRADGIDYYRDSHGIFTLQAAA